MTKDVKVVAAPVKETPHTPAPITPAPVVTPAPETKFAVFGASVRKQVLYANVTGATGSVRVTLRRGKTIVSSKRVTIKAGRLALRLPRKPVAGKHVLEVRSGARIASTSVKLRTLPGGPRS